MKGSVFLSDSKIERALDEWDKKMDARLQKSLRELDYSCYYLCISLMELNECLPDIIKYIFSFFKPKHGEHEKNKS